MTDPNDDLFDPEMDDDEVQAEFERLSDLLLLHVTAFAEKHELPDAILATMLMQIAVSTRMMAYVVAVDEPTSLGLRLDLDRFRRDIEESLHEMKKRAEAFIIHARATIAAAAREEAEKG